MIRKVMVLLFVVLLAHGCAAGGGAGGESGDTGRVTTSNSRVITQQELAEHPELTSVADAVRRLRPRWRNEAVYVDDQPYVGSSRDIQLTFVREIRYLDLSEAQMRWGQSISTSVILVTTR